MDETDEIVRELGKHWAAAREAFHDALDAYNAGVAVDNEVFHDRGGFTEGRSDKIVQALLDAGWSPPPPGPRCAECGGFGFNHFFHPKK